MIVFLFDSCKLYMDKWVSQFFFPWYIWFISYPLHPFGANISNCFELVV